MLSLVVIKNGNSTAIGYVSRKLGQSSTPPALRSLFTSLRPSICTRLWSSSCNFFTTIRLRLLQTFTMHLQALLVIGAAALSATAAPTSTSHVVHEKRQSQPLSWTKYSRVDPSTVLPVRIGLTQSNLESGPSLLDEV